MSGTVHLQLGILPPPGEIPLGLTEEWAQDVLGKLSRRSRGEDDVELKKLRDSLLAAPAVSFGRKGEDVSILINDDVRPARATV